MRFPGQHPTPVAGAPVIAALIPATPTRGSITASTALALPILWVASGHQNAHLFGDVDKAQTTGLFSGPKRG
jgi:hypothetical protein